MRYKTLQSKATLFSDILKFNPYHDSRGRFASAGAAASFTYKPGASTAHDKAIENEKARSADNGKGFKGTLYHGSPNTDIKEFDMSRAGQNTSSGEKLLFFTDSKQMADDFSYERLDGSSKFFQRRGEKGRVYEVDVEMKNPLDFRNLSDKDIDNILKLDDEGLLTRADIQRYANSNHQLLKAGLTLTADSLKELGYDGLIANTGKAGHNSLEYAVVDSKQAKIRKGYIMYEVDNQTPLSNFAIKKADDDKRLVFGWALVSATSDGQKIIDYQGDIVEQEDLEEGAYEYVLNFRDAGEEHVPGLRKKARMVESVVFTEEKLNAMGIPAGTVPYGWWIGFYVDDDKTWELIKNGTYKMFSIEGRAIREPVANEVTKSDALKYLDEFPEFGMWHEENLDATEEEKKAAKAYYDSKKKVAKSFSELVEKFNPYHDSKGRFTTAGTAASFTYAPGRSKAHDLAIDREKERHSAMANPGKEYGLSQEQHEKLEQLVNGSVFAANKYRKEIGMSDEDYEKYKGKFKTPERTKQIRDERERAKREEEAKQKAELDERVKQELPGLNQDAISRANSVSFFDHGSVAAREALKRVDDYRERNKITDDMTDEQKAYMQQREEEYKQLITEYYNDSNSRFANNPSWAVTGPANYNTRRSEKLSNAAQRKAQEYEEKLQRFEENTQRKLKSMEPEDKQIARWRNGKWSYGETISADDPLATKKLQAKLDYQKELQQHMKDVNAYYRKNGTVKGAPGVSDTQAKQIEADMARSWRTNPKPYESFELTNNNNSIKATESRLKQMQNRQATASSGGSGGGSSFKGGEIIRNTDINRLQIKFDGIPDAATRQKLKSSGWRWSPKNGVWQRQLTDNAERSAKQITDELNKSFDGAKTFSELMLYE